MIRGRNRRLYGPKALGRRSLHFLILLFTSLFLCLVAIPSFSLAPPAAVLVAQQSDPLAIGQQLYQEGRYGEAAQVLERAIQNAETQGDDRGQAIALRNLALVQQQLGQWEEAEAAIARSLALLEQPELAGETAVLAQVLDVQGRLQFYRGQGEAALATWERSQALYDALGETQRSVQARVNQTEAMQSLGLYRRAVQTLTELQQEFENQPASPQQVTLLQTLGNALRVAGDLPQAESVVQQSLEMAQELGLSEAIAAAYLSLGNIAYARANNSLEALDNYEQAARVAESGPVALEAELNAIRVLANRGRYTEVEGRTAASVERIEALSASRLSVYARINLSESLLRLGDSGAIAPEAIANLLATAVQQAQTLGDRQAESYAVGLLGKVYEQAGRWEDAQTLTKQALELAQSVNVPELRYLWEWQLGRILKAEGDREGAIAAYTSSINSLQAVRQDLAATNPEAQFSFRDSVEPIHRELVDLLLDPNSEATDDQLKQARQTIESLQLAELDNFFREACLNARGVEIDEIDRQAAVLYPILLRDRLSVVLSLPGQALQAYSVPVARDEVGTVVDELLAYLRNAGTEEALRGRSQQLYDWLIRPIRAELDASGVKTVVFVPDGKLRSVPMAVLHDGTHYFIEDYSVALAPTLQLLEASQLGGGNITALLGGVSEGRGDFAPLPGVEQELNRLHEILKGRVILNDAFTQSELTTAVDDTPFPVVHLATHGVFGSTLDDTFILTWDDRLDINELGQLLQSADVSRRRPIELLVLSACQTAAGDDRSALGLAGVAVRSGARSTIASLWNVSDEATMRLMIQLYEELRQGGVTKAEALRQAQLSLIQAEEQLLAEGPRSARNFAVEALDPDSPLAIARPTEPIGLSHPYFWSAFVLIGNWL